MTNREKLNKTNIFDLLMKINDGFAEEPVCVLDAFSDKKPPCPDDLSNCDECITKWLNEEVRS